VCWDFGDSVRVWCDTILTIWVTKGRSGHIVCRGRLKDARWMGDLGRRVVSVKIRFSPCGGLHNLLRGNCKYLSKCYGGCNTYVQSTYNMLSRSYFECNIFEHPIPPTVYGLSTYATTSWQSNQSTWKQNQHFESKIEDSFSFLNICWREILFLIQRTSQRM